MPENVQPINYFIKWSRILFNIAHVKHYVLLFMIWDFDLEFSTFLTFGYFWGCTLVSINKIVSFTFLRYFNLNVEYKGVLSIFLPLFASMIVRYTISNHISSPPPFLKFSDLPLALFLKRNHPEKYRVSKCFFIRNKFL